MKIEITNEGDKGYFLYSDKSNKPLKNMRSSFINPFAFADQDILCLIGEKNFYNSFQQGKYIYEVSKKHLLLITGERAAENWSELAMYQN